VYEWRLVQLALRGMADVFFCPSPSCAYAGWVDRAEVGVAVAVDHMQMTNPRHTHTQVPLQCDAREFHCPMCWHTYCLVCIHTSHLCFCLKLYP
jgi:hypothetical protein